MKPNLIDANTFNIVKNNNVQKTFLQKVGGSMSSTFLNIFEDYKYLIIVIIIICVILYLMYLTNKKNKLDNPDNFTVNYNREVEYYDNEIIDVKDKIENEEKLSTGMLNIIKNKINSFDNLQPMNVNNLN